MLTKFQSCVCVLETVSDSCLSSCISFATVSMIPLISFRLRAREVNVLKGNKLKSILPPPSSFNIDIFVKLSHFCCSLIEAPVTINSSSSLESDSISTSNFTLELSLLRWNPLRFNPLRLSIEMYWNSSKSRVSSSESIESAFKLKFTHTSFTRLIWFQFG